MAWLWLNAYCYLIHRTSVHRLLMSEPISAPEYSQMMDRREGRMAETESVHDVATSVEGPRGCHGAKRAR